MLKIQKKAIPRPNRGSWVAVRMIMLVQIRKNARPRM